MKLLLDNIAPLIALLEHVPLLVWGGLFFAVLVGVAGRYDRNKHLVYRLGAWQRMRQLHKIEDTAQKLPFLKSTHHFEFEEMILDELKKKGHQITRSKAYTGDGGIDGRVTIRGQKYFIQAKCYTGHINPKHMIKLAYTCKKAGIKGLFVHTGKTGKKSGEVAGRTGITIISGDKLMKLFSPR